MVTYEDAKRCGYERQIRDAITELVAFDSRQAKLLWSALEQSLVGLEILRILGVLKLKGGLHGDPKEFYRKIQKIAEKVDTQTKTQALDPQAVQSAIEGEALLPLEGLGG
jgi:hypothetical protein